VLRNGNFADSDQFGRRLRWIFRIQRNRFPVLGSHFLVVKDRGGKSGEVDGAGLAGFVFVLVVALTASTFPFQIGQVGSSAVAVPDDVVRVGFQC
jgi:hypothetical protein